MDGDDEQLGFLLDELVDEQVFLFDLLLKNPDFFIAMIYALTEPVLLLGVAGIWMWR